MNKKPLAVLIVIILIIIAIFVFTRETKAPATTTEPQTNVNMLSGTSTVPLIKETVSYFPGAQGYYVRPAAERIYPAVVMIHENRGLRPEIKTMAEELAKEGYAVLAVDLFNGKVVESQDEARALTASFNQATGTANLRAAVVYLKSQGATKIASLGWCFGGRQSIELAISGEKLDATIVYYGGGMATTTVRLAPIKWPVLGIFGDKDQAISTTTVKQFETALNTLKVPNEIHIYPGVGHAFANPSGMNYAPNETKDAWAKTVAFLKKTLN